MTVRRICWSLVLVVAMTLVACQKKVALLPTEPDLVTHCEADEALLGDWISDSVRITTLTDTNDSSTTDAGPTLQYRMRIDCGADTLFRLFYDNFAGVRTVDVHAANFEAGERGAYVFSALDVAADTSDAQFVLRWQVVDSAHLNAWFRERANAHQTTTTEIFFRKD